MTPTLNNLGILQFLCKVLRNFHIILLARTPMEFFVEIHTELEYFILHIFPEKEILFFLIETENSF